eukprot:CAMPEP_0170453254 /NCGR_PEP_ID=MMETSP0123-20130129/1887_1 /TAXON_ID=182087 /ORGANISM="Favella ehrenbergii, Strain Fehren 1" /LENGTH=93 /DNA_ID=CAMNT_0010715545 /DNA_START=1444 /DNA_END=1725 /DNA_ORIENTATION=+
MLASCSKVVDDCQAFLSNYFNLQKQMNLDTADSRDYLASQATLFADRVAQNETLILDYRVALEAKVGQGAQLRQSIIKDIERLHENVADLESR